MRAAIITDGIVTNIAEVEDQSFADEMGWVDATGGSVGDIWDGNIFTTPSASSLPQEIPLISFSQLVSGLVAMEWITVQEGEDWLTLTSLPAEIDAMISQLPQEQKFPARARALRMSQADRNDPMVVALAEVRDIHPEDIDVFFLQAGGHMGQPDGITNAEFLSGLDRVGVDPGDAKFPSFVTRGSPSIQVLELSVAQLNNIFEEG